MVNSDFESDGLLFGDKEFVDVILYRIWDKNSEDLKIRAKY